MKRQAEARLGYLLSHYPAANHTYLFREVCTLRAAGLPVVVAAITGDGRALDMLDPEEVDERARTFVVKWVSAAAIATAHFVTLVDRPLGFARGLATALKLAGPDFVRIAYHLIYFSQAVVAGRYFVRNRCTHVHTHYAATVGVIAASIFGFELSASIHGSAEFINPGPSRLREKIAACTFVRAISFYGRSQLMLASPPSEWPKLEVVRLGVDPHAFPYIARGAAEPRAFRLLTIGQLQPAKGVHLLLDAVALLVHEGRDVVLTIVGDGPERAALIAHAERLRVSGRVTFAGALSQNPVRELLSKADGFALASFAEGIPVVLMEAMASGVPCVATRITGIPELIEDETSGLLVTPADTSALAIALRRLVDDDKLRSRLAKCGREAIVRDYDLARNTAHLVHIFHLHLV